MIKMANFMLYIYIFTPVEKMISQHCYKFIKYLRCEFLKGSSSFGWNWVESWLNFSPHLVPQLGRCTWVVNSLRNHTWRLCAGFYIYISFWLVKIMFGPHSVIQCICHLPQFVPPTELMLCHLPQCWLKRSNWAESCGSSGETSCQMCN